jgi:hypothetical protein
MHRSGDAAAEKVHVDLLGENFLDVARRSGGSAADLSTLTPCKGGLLRLAPGPR